MTDDVTIIRRRARAALGSVSRLASKLPFTFPRAGRGAPREVKKAIERYRKLPLQIRQQVNLWQWLLGPEGTPAYKYEKVEVQYGGPPPGREAQRCANCNSQYLHTGTNTYICEKMRGVIAPEAWCALWNPVIDGRAYRAYQEGE